MFIDLVDHLRCPNPHEETWLVASADRVEGRDIIEGTLGCPICGAEYPIRAGVTWFAEPAESGASSDSSSPNADPELALRLAAFLDLSEAQGLALLVGSWGSAAPFLRRVVPTHLVLLDPRPGVTPGNGISVLEGARSIPLADATCRGVALDEPQAHSARLEAAVRVLLPRGRLIAPAAVPTPAGVTQLARDDRLWVAERDPAPPTLVGIRQRGR